MDRAARRRRPVRRVAQSAVASLAAPASQADDPTRASVMVAGVGVNVSQTLPSGVKVTVPLARAPFEKVALTVHAPSPVPVTVGATPVPPVWHGPDTVTEAKVRPQGAWMLATGTGPGGDTQPLLLVLLHAVDPRARARVAEVVAMATRKPGEKKEGMP